jgi:hypothetical protein
MSGSPAIRRIAQDAIWGQELAKELENRGVEPSPENIRAAVSEMWGDTDGDLYRTVEGRVRSLDEDEVMATQKEVITRTLDDNAAGKYSYLSDNKNTITFRNGGVYVGDNLKAVKAPSVTTTVTVGGTQQSVNLQPITATTNKRIIINSEGQGMLVKQAARDKDGNLWVNGEIATKPDGKKAFSMDDLEGTLNTPESADGQPKYTMKASGWRKLPSTAKGQVINGFGLTGEGTDEDIINNSIIGAHGGSVITVDGKNSSGGRVVYPK